MADILFDLIELDINWCMGRDQYLRAKKAATPAFIQYSSDLLLGSSKNITKFVECPVVERVPLRDTTL